MRISITTQTGGQRGRVLPGDFSQRLRSYVPHDAAGIPRPGEYDLPTDLARAVVTAHLAMPLEPTPAGESVPWWPWPWKGTDYV